MKLLGADFDVDVLTLQKAVGNEGYELIETCVSYNTNEVLPAFQKMNAHTQVQVYHYL